MTKVEAGHVYVFTRMRGEVERVDGKSAGKRMDVPERALVVESELLAA